MDTSKTSTLQDDLESFYWVILYLVLRYMRTDITESTLSDWMAKIFDSHHTIGEESVGGDMKYVIITGGARTPFAALNVFGNPPMTSFLAKVRLHFDKWYGYFKGLDDEALARYVEEDIPLPEAKAKVLVNTNGLALRNHAALEADFRKALAKDTWPQDDKALDYLKHATSKRKLPFQPSSSKRAKTSRGSSLGEGSSSALYATRSSASATSGRHGASRRSGNRGSSQSHQRST